MPSAEVVAAFDARIWVDYRHWYCGAVCIRTITTLGTPAASVVCIACCIERINQYLLHRNSKHAFMLYILMNTILGHNSALQAILGREQSWLMT